MSGFGRRYQIRSYRCVNGEIQSHLETYVYFSNNLELVRAVFDLEKAANGMHYKFVVWDTHREKYLKEFK